MTGKRHLEDVTIETNTPPTRPEIFGIFSPTVKTTYSFELLSAESNIQEQSELVNIWKCSQIPK